MQDIAEARIESSVESHNIDHLSKMMCDFGELQLCQWKFFGMILSGLRKGVEELNHWYVLGF